jgi:hypothetical protein
VTVATKDTKTVSHEGHEDHEETSHEGHEDHEATHEKTFVTFVSFVAKGFVAGGTIVQQRVIAWLDERLDLADLRRFIAEKRVPIHAQEVWY